MARRFKITYNAPVVLTFTLLALVVHGLTETVWPSLTMDYFVARPELHGTSSYFAVVTHIVGHANWAHFVGNFTLILLLGPILEERHGSVSLLFMIVVTALVTGVINLLFFDTGLLGASGIVFMFILLASTANVKAGQIPLTFILVAILYLGAEVISAMQNDNISQMAHLVGGLVGGAFGFINARLEAREAVLAPDVVSKVDVSRREK